MKLSGVKTLILWIVMITVGTGCRMHDQGLEGTYSAFLPNGSHDPIAMEMLKHMKLRLQPNRRFELDSGRGIATGEWWVASNVVHLHITLLDGRPASSAPHTNNTVLNLSFYVRDGERTLLPTASEEASMGFRRIDS